MLMQMIVSDIQPVQNLKVLVYAGADRKMEWGKHWITQGFMGKLYSVDCVLYICVFSIIDMYIF